MRVILDSRLRLPLDSRVVKTAQEDLLVLCSFAEEKKRKQLQQRGVWVEQIPKPTADGHPDLTAVVKHLGEREITSLMIEGGAMVNWAALRQGSWTRFSFITLLRFWQVQARCRFQRARDSRT